MGLRYPEEQGDAERLRRHGSAHLANQLPAMQSSDGRSWFAPCVLEPHGFVRVEEVMFARYTHSYRYSLLGVAALSAASALVTVAVLAQTNALAANSMSVHSASALLKGAALLVAMIAAGVSTQYLSANVGARFVAQLRQEVAQQILDIKYGQFVEVKPKIMGVFIHDIGQMSPILMIVPAMMSNALLVLCCGVYLCAISPLLFAVLMVALALPMSVAYLLIAQSKTEFDRLREAEGHLHESIQALSDGKKEMSLNRHRMEHYRGEILWPAIATSAQQMARTQFNIGVHQSWSSTMLYMVMFVVVYVSGAVLDVPMATVVAFVLGGVFLFGPITFLLNCSQAFARGFSSTRNLEKLGLSLQPVTTRTVSASTGTLDWQNIRMTEALYTYPSAGSGAGACIGPLSFELTRGETVFVVGENGSGKSTLLLMLVGLLEPQRGDVLVDGVSIHSRLPAYQSLFAGVFGDFFLFKHALDGTGSSAPDEVTLQLLEQVQLENEVSVRRGEFSRINLSSGQKKRLALVQCLLEDREIYIFDEWAADQDPVFRRYFYEVVLRSLKERGKTVVVVSHDDRFYGLADRVVCLRSGIVVAAVGHIPSAAAEGVV